MFCMTPMCHQVRYQKLCPPFARMTKEPFFPRLFSTSQKKARTYWTRQMEYCNQWLRLRRWFKFSLSKFDEYLWMIYIHFVYFPFVLLQFIYFILLILNYFNLYYSICIILHSFRLEIIISIGLQQMSVHSLHYDHSQFYTSFQKRRCYTSLKSSQFLQMYIMLIAQGKESKLFWNVNAYFTTDVASPVHMYSRSRMKLKRQWSKYSTGKYTQFILVVKTTC